MSLRSGYELATVGASSSIHPPAVATDRIPIRLQIFAWVTAKDPAGVAFNLSFVLNNLRRSDLHQIISFAG